MIPHAARLGVGAAGIALVGCGGDDDDSAPPAADDQQQEQQIQQQEQEQAQQEAQQQAEQQEAPAPTDTIQIEQVVLAAEDATVTLLNTGAAAVDLSGWFICQRPSYWPFPSVSVAAGARLVVHTAAGANTDSDVFAGGAFGRLNGDGNSAVRVYHDNGFGNAGSMVAYVAWNGGGGRLGVAQEAGLWGDGDLNPSDGDTLAYAGEGTGADAYSVSSGGSASSVGTGDPEVSTAGTADGEDDDGYAGPGY